MFRDSLLKPRGMRAAGKQEHSRISWRFDTSRNWIVLLVGTWFQSPDRRRKMSLGLLSIYGPTESSDPHGRENYLMGLDGPGP